MEFVTSLAFTPLPELCALAAAADAAGFHSVALADHVVHPKTIRTPYPYTKDGQTRWPPFTEWPDPWVAVGAMATTTSRLRFYTSIYVLPMRNPFLVAKSLATASILSQGRVALGVGAGWMRDEFELMGQAFERRGRRLDEMLEVLRKLWAGGWVEHHGEFYDFEPLEMSPAPTAPIPIYVGGVSKPALRRAATRADGWISDLHSTQELRDLVAEIQTLRSDSARAGQPFSVFASATDAFDIDGYRRLEDAGVTHVLTMPWLFYAGPTEDLDRKCEGVRRFGEDVVQKMR